MGRKGRRNATQCGRFLPISAFAADCGLVAFIFGHLFRPSLKEFIVHRKDIFPSHKYNNTYLATLFGNRTNVIKEVQAHVNFSKTLLGKVSHYYDIRNNLVHQRATVLITDEQVDDYRKTIEQVLKKLFGVKFPVE